MNVAIVCIGNLEALAGYLKERDRAESVASFDNDPQKINKVISGVKCHPYDDLEK
jgi:NADH/NAD ratio-sensing transcriptional regulator Rex